MQLAGTGLGANTADSYRVWVWAVGIRAFGSMAISPTRALVRRSIGYLMIQVIEKVNEH